MHNMAFEEHYNIFDDIIYSEYNFRIDYTLNYDNLDKVYFKVIISNKVIRISMKEPMYYESDRKLNELEIDKLISILNSKYKDTNNTIWETIIIGTNEQRSGEGLPLIENLPIPDYKLLLKGEIKNE